MMEKNFMISKQLKHMTFLLVLCLFSLFSCNNDDTNEFETTEAVNIANNNNWELVNLNTTSILNRIKFVSDQKGFIIGNDGKLFKTTDAGENWVEVSTGVNHNLQSISFANDNKAMINGLITLDGGNQWTIHEATKEYFCYYVSEDRLVGGSNKYFNGRALSSNDDGLNWDLKYDASIGWFENSDFMDNIGYMASWYGGNIIKTTDAGLTWEKILSGTDSPDTSDGIYGDFGPIKMLNADEFIVSSGRGIIKSTDGGETFSNIYDTNLYGIDIFNENQWIGVGVHGLIAITIDGGSSWETINYENENGTPIHLKDVSIGNKYIFSVGSNGTLLRKAI